MIAIEAIQGRTVVESGTRRLLAVAEMAAGYALYREAGEWTERPVAAGPSVIEGTRSPAITRPGILAVDDDSAIRNLLQIVLRQYGFMVWLAANGQEALQIYQQQWGNITLVLLDVRMPGWDGPQTLAALQKLDPTVRCCFLTGEAGKYSEEELRQRGAEQVFAKPFRPADLGSSLGRLATRPTAGR